jgi:hypothetical protein
MSYKDLRLLQKIKEFNQMSQGATVTQSYTGTDYNLLKRATEDPKKNYIIYGEGELPKEITAADMNKFDYRLINVVPVTSKYF